MKHGKVCARTAVVLALAVSLAGGCASSGNFEKVSNPMLVEGPTYSMVWKNTVDTIEERFEIARRKDSEGVIETEYKMAYPPLWVPWASDALTSEYFFEETLHEVRRKVVARLKRLADRTTEVRITVRRERHNYEHPPTAYNEHYSLYDSTLTNRKETPLPGYVSEWTYVGADVEMEQLLLRRILEKLGAL